MNETEKQIVIDWENFGKHHGRTKQIKRVKTKMGGTGLATLWRDAKISHRAFLTREEAEVLHAYTGLNWRHSTPDQIASGNYGRFTIEVPERGRFFTNEEVGAVDEYILPVEVFSGSRGFTPIQAYKVVEKGGVEDTEQEGGAPEPTFYKEGTTDMLVDDNMMTTDNIVGAGGHADRREVVTSNEDEQLEFAEAIEDEKAKVSTTGMVEADEGGLTVDESATDHDPDYVPSDEVNAEVAVDEVIYADENSNKDSE